MYFHEFISQESFVLMKLFDESRLITRVYFPLSSSNLGFSKETPKGFPKCRVEVGTT